jgi:hypothetical protein
MPDYLHRRAAKTLAKILREHLDQEAENAKAETSPRGPPRLHMIK